MGRGLLIDVDVINQKKKGEKKDILGEGEMRDTRWPVASNYRTQLRVAMIRIWSRYEAGSSCALPC